MKKLIVIHLLFLASYAASTQSVIYVNIEAATNGTGTSWNDEFKYLQDGLDHARSLASAQNPVEIWVASGLYYPDEGMGYTNDARDSSFLMSNYISLFGGFEGIELSKEQRNWAENHTVLSGEINQNSNTSDNSYNIIKNRFSSSDPLTSLSVLDGFIIDGGRANGSGVKGVGAGIYNFFASPLIKNCWFKSNEAVLGGAVYNERGGASFYNCIFTDNNATANLGTVIYNNQHSDSTEIVNCTFYNNDPDYGTAITSSANSDITLLNTIIWGSATSFNDGGSIPIVKNCILQGGYGAGTDIIDSDPFFIDTANYDLQLRSCSPAIDAGTDSSIEFDYNGQGRLQFNSADIGAYEYYQQIIYVDQAATGDNGASWESAYNRLHDALVDADACNDLPIQIWIADGTYYPDEGDGITNNDRSSSFYLLKNVSWYGGFAGGEKSLDERDWPNNVAVLSGDIDQDDHVADGNTSNAYNVIYNPFIVSNRADSTSIIDGITISDGYASGLLNHQDSGGGLNCQFTSPAIANCTFKDNYAQTGGAIYNGDYSIIVRNSLFENNKSEIRGGAILNIGYSSIIVDSCRFNANQSEGSGGALYFSSISNSSNLSTISMSIFSSNISMGSGGAISNYSNDIVIEDCEFDDNSALGLGKGGAINLNEVTQESRIKNCSFVNNGAAEGGALLIDGSPLVNACHFEANRTLIPNNNGGAVSIKKGRPLIVNSLFYDNYAYFNGGAIQSLPEANPNIINCTFYKNFSNFPGGAIINFAEDSMTIVNSIFWDNTIDLNNNSNEIGGSDLDTIYNCIVEGGANQGINMLNGVNIFDVYPRFRDTLLSIDLSLLSCSPAIDQGNNLIINQPFDLNGNQRKVQATDNIIPVIDIGAYESQNAFDPSCDDCPIHLELTGIVESGLYTAYSSITCNGILADNSSVILSAPDSIVFHHEFNAGMASELEVLLDACIDVE